MTDLDVPRENDTLLTNFRSEDLWVYQEAIKRYDKQRGVRWWRPMKPLLRISAYAYAQNATYRLTGYHSLHLCVGRSESPGLDGFWRIHKEIKSTVWTTTAQLK